MKEVIKVRPDELRRRLKATKTAKEAAKKRDQPKK
jgi:hypothetical protein